MMRLYLPRVEARLRGITAWWFSRKRGNLHTIPCTELERDRGLAYNRHFTQIQVKHTSSKIQSNVQLRNQNKRRQPQMLDHRSSQLGSTIDQQNNTTNMIFIELPLELSCVICTSIINTWNYLEVSVSHEDSANSHMRDQDN